MVTKVKRKVISDKVKENRFEKIKQAWAEAPRDEGGLKLIKWHEFKDLTQEQREELLTEPVIITWCNIHTWVESKVLVILTFEDYLAKIPPTVNPLRKPMMMRHEGRMFRECV